MARMKKNSGATLTDPWGSLDGGSQVAPPKERASLSQRVKRLVLWSVLLTYPLGVLVTFSAIRMGQEAKDDSTTASAAPALTSPGRFVATRTIEEWLATTPSPVPGGRIVSWDGSDTRLPPLDLQGKPVAEWVSSTENFTLADAGGNQFRSAVQVALDPRGGAKALSQPSLVPVPTAGTDSWASDTNPWPGLTVKASSDAVKAAVDSWARAFTSGNPDTLRLAVGDTDPARSYVPLPGPAALSATIEASGQNTGLSRLVARVNVEFTAPGGPGLNTQPPKATYDVLLTKADTAAPSVVAWGGPGSGPSLEPFANAVPIADREAPMTPAPSTTSEGK